MNDIPTHPNLRTSLSLLIFGAAAAFLLMFLPHLAFQQFSSSSPCGTDMGGVACAFAYGMEAILILAVLQLVCFITLFVYVRIMKIPNSTYIMGFSLLTYFVVLPLGGTHHAVLAPSFEPVLSLPAILVGNYLIFTASIRKSRVFNLLLWLGCALLLIGGLYTVRAVNDRIQTALAAKIVHTFPYVADPEAYTENFVPVGTAVKLGDTTGSDLMRSPLYPNGYILTYAVFDHTKQNPSDPCYIQHDINYDKFWHVFWVEFRRYCNGGKVDDKFYGPYRYPSQTVFPAY